MFPKFQHQGKMACSLWFQTPHSSDQHEQTNPPYKHNAPFQLKFHISQSCNGSSEPHHQLGQYVHRQKLYQER
uniref:Uncharacterized protein n=1 Tax=Rhizophora mucronata TaxID=61149 RepID=A0A2P2MZ61_RHIMU